jgi:hypothetical protein
VTDTVISLYTLENKFRAALAATLRQGGLHLYGLTSCDDDGGPLQRLAKAQGFQTLRIGTSPDAPLDSLTTDLTAAFDLLTGPRPLFVALPVTDKAHQDRLTKALFLNVGALAEAPTLVLFLKAEDMPATLAPLGFNF